VRFVLSFACSDFPARYNDDSLNDVLHYEEIINGRAYLIEVSPVGLDRWRAQIVRTPGGSAALMPFYGVSPDEAANLLSSWLTRNAHVPAAPPVPAATAR
jgi:hypothetical protein